MIKQEVLALAMAAVTSFGLAASSKPNFVFVLTDDQRWDALGVVQREMGERGRFPWLATPNMDSIAADGVRFRNAFVTMPLCAPSRAVFLSGRYNHANGVANNHTPFPVDSVTYPSLLGKAGYTTAHFGKWHMGGQRGKRPGYDHSVSFIGQGRYWNCPMEYDGVTTQTQGWVDDVSTSFAIAWITENKDRPFLATIGYKAPHGPHEPPDRAKNRFEGKTARSVPNLSVPAIYRELTEVTTAPKRKGLIPGSNIPHFRSLSAVDDSIGQLLDALQALGLKENTMVVFAGDNGYYHGEHRLGDKRSLYDESLRIPYLFSYPDRFAKGTTNDEMVLNIDLAPTILELAGVVVPKQMQGKSLVPLLDGKKAKWRDAFLTEYFEENTFPTTPNTVAVRTAEAKIIKYPGHDEWTELFDLKADPYETKNLISDSASKELLKQMMTKFNEQVKTTGYSIPDYADSRATTGTAVEKQPVQRRKRQRR